MWRICSKIRFTFSVIPSMFTNDAIARNFSICLRCQVRMSLKSSVRPSRCRQSSVFTHPRVFTSTTGLRQEDEKSVHEDNPPLRSKTRDYPATCDLHGASRPPPKHSLGMVSLGRPAEVLVMRKTGRATQRLGDIFTEESLKPLPLALEGSPDALLHGIDSSRGIAENEHIFANIDSVKNEFLKSQARKGQHLTREEYDELLSRLSAGFQKNHLIDYFQKFCTGRVFDALNLSFPYTSTRLARSMWHSGAFYQRKKISAPLLTEIEGESSREKASNFMSEEKDWHARNVIQTCWGFETNLDGMIGKMAVRLQPIHFKIVFGHARNPLKDFLHNYSVKFEISRKQSVMCIEADLVLCEVVLRMLLQILDRITSTTVVLNPEATTALPKQFDKGYIEQVQELTNTVICQGKAPKILDGDIQYTVHYLGPEKSDLEDVQRILNNEARARVTNVKAAVWIKVPLDSTASAVPKEFGESLPLIARSTQWARFVDDRFRRLDSEAEGDTLQTAKLLDALPYSDLVVDETHRFLSYRGKTRSLRMNGAHEHWEQNLTRWSQVILGQVAFPIHQAQNLEAKLKNAKTSAELVLTGVQKTISKMERVFATTLPGMTRALEAADLSLHPTERLLIHMVPSSAQGLSPELINLVPELEILVRVNSRDKAIQLQGARLVLVHEALDLLLPSHATDLRLMRREYLYCHQTEHDRNEQQPSDPCLTAFIEESQLDVWGSQRLRTPNYLQISIPASSIPSLGRDQSLPDMSALSVNYRFAGIEHRSFVSLAAIGSYTLEYNTIQAGKIVGRREELAIRLGRQLNMNRLSDITRDTAKGLLGAALEVAQTMR